MGKREKIGKGEKERRESEREEKNISNKAAVSLKKIKPNNFSVSLECITFQCNDRQ